MDKLVFMRAYLYEKIYYERDIFMFKKLVTGALILSLTASSFVLLPGTNETTAAEEEWKLTWSDEFDGNALNKNVWNVEVNGYGGWNDEHQYYKDGSDTIQVSDGTLKIIGRKQTVWGTDAEGVYKSYDYTSARINTENKVALGNGRIEARIKLPIFTGTFPAFWLMGNNGKQWPECGEIDIMEAVNTENIAYGTAHWPKKVGTGSDEINSKGNGTYGWNLNLAQWHTYGVERTDTEIKWYVDNRVYHTLDLTTDAANKAPLKLDAYILLNLAIGGSWPGHTIDDSAFPATMEVDYVRYYQRNSNYNPVYSDEDIVDSSGSTWSTQVGSWSNANGSFTTYSRPSDGFTANLSAIGNSEWGVQASLPNLKYRPGYTYTYQCTLLSNIDKTVFLKLQGEGTTELAAEYIQLKANTPYQYQTTYTVPADYDKPLSLFFALGGGANGETLNQNTAMNIRVSDVHFSTKVEGETTTAEPTTVQPTTAEPTTREVTTAEPTTKEVTTQEPTTEVSAKEAVKIEGYQISTAHEGFRVVGSVEPTINHKTVVEKGLVYGLTNLKGTQNTGITETDMVVGSTNPYVRSYAATAEGILHTQMGTSNTATYYALTMSFGAKNVGAFKTQYAVRSYAKLSDGSYVYSDVSTFNVYDIATFLYNNKKMSNEASHNYLYNTILKVVNPNFQEVEYPVWSVIVPKTF